MLNIVNNLMKISFIIRNNIIENKVGPFHNNQMVLEKPSHEIILRLGKFKEAIIDSAL